MDIVNTDLKTSGNIKILNFMKFVNRLPMSDTEKDIFIKKYIIELKKEDVVKENVKKRKNKVLIALKKCFLN
jgi:hypothetical protein